MHWETLSPDLTAGGGPEGEPEADQASRRTRRRPAISALAFSHKETKTIWAATNNGLINLTRDGGATWKNVAPEALKQDTISNHGSVAERSGAGVRDGAAGCEA